MITPKITRRLIVFNGKNDAPWALNRPDICVIYDIDAHDEPPFLAMEVGRGQTLCERWPMDTQVPWIAPIN